MKVHLKTEEELPGKTIKELINPGGSHFIIWFTDDSFASFSIHRGYESGDESVCIDHEFDSTEFSNWALYRAGFMSQEELNAAIKLKDEQRKKRMEEYRRAQYEQLKKEFECA